MTPEATTARRGGPSSSSLLFIIFSVLLITMAGCLGNELESGSEALETNAGAALNDERLQERTTIVKVRSGERAVEADVACAMSGGPKLPRSSVDFIKAGTDELEVNVSLAATYSSIQVGYVLDSNDAGHAPSNNRSIAWLPQVGPGQEATFRVDVATEQTEEPGEPRWTFYQRMQPPTVDDICYTGGGMGEKEITIDAVP